MTATLVDRSPTRTMQTFSANFCRCAVTENLVWLPGAAARPSAAPRIAQRAVIAISGSEPAEVELWSLEVKFLRQLSVSSLFSPHNEHLSHCCLLTQYSLVMTVSSCGSFGKIALCLARRVVYV